MASMTRSSFAAGTSAAFASIAIVTSPARAAQFTYKFANDVPAEHPLNVRGRQLWNAVKAESRGRLDVQMYPNNLLGGDSSMLTQLRSGALQFFGVVGAILQSVVPAAAIEGVGFAFKNEAEALAAMDGRLGAWVRGKIRAKGIHAFERMYANGMRQITASTKPIRGPEDLAGFKIRTPPARLFIELFKTLGASPTPVNFNELYTALQTHVVDGEENSLVVIETGKLFEVQKYLSLTNHSWAAFWMCANMDAWNALPHDIQIIVTRNINKYALPQRRDVELLSESLANKLRRRGMLLNTADPAPFKARLAPFYAQFKSEFGSTAWGLLESYAGRLA